MLPDAQCDVIHFALHAAARGFSHYYTGRSICFGAVFFTYINEGLIWFHKRLYFLLCLEVCLHQ